MKPSHKRLVRRRIQLGWTVERVAKSLGVDREEVRILGREQRLMTWQGTVSAISKSLVKLPKETREPRRRELVGKIRADVRYMYKCLKTVAQAARVHAKRAAEMDQRLERLRKRVALLKGKARAKAVRPTASALEDFARSRRSLPLFQELRKRIHGEFSAVEERISRKSVVLKIGHHQVKVQPKLRRLEIVYTHRGDEASEESRTVVGQEGIQEILLLLRQ